MRKPRRVHTGDTAIARRLDNCSSEPDFKGLRGWNRDVVSITGTMKQLWLCTALPILTCYIQTQRNKCPNSAKKHAFNPLSHLPEDDLQCQAHTELVQVPSPKNHSTSVLTVYCNLSYLGSSEFLRLPFLPNILKIITLPSATQHLWDRSQLTQTPEGLCPLRGFLPVHMLPTVVKHQSLAYSYFHPLSTITSS